MLAGFAHTLFGAWVCVSGCVRNSALFEIAHQMPRTENLDKDFGDTTGSKISLRRCNLVPGALLGPISTSLVWHILQCQTHVQSTCLSSIESQRHKPWSGACGKVLTVLEDRSAAKGRWVGSAWTAASPALPQVPAPS